MSQHTSGSSDRLIPEQFFLIPDTALPYRKHSSFLYRTQLFLMLHSSFIPDAQLFYILCTRYAGARVVTQQKWNTGTRKNSKYGTICGVFYGGNTGKCHVICIKYGEMGSKRALKSFSWSMLTEQDTDLVWKRKVPIIRSIFPDPPYYRVNHVIRSH